MKTDGCVYVDIQELQAEAITTAPNNPTFWMPAQQNTRHICHRMNILVAFLAFHGLNVVLGVAAWFTVVFGLFFSLVLLPLCLCGLSVFQLIAFTVEMLAFLDIALANTIPRQMPLLPSSQTSAIQSEGEVDTTAGVTTHIAYFLFIKPLVSLLSFVVLALSVVMPIQLIMHGDVTVIHCITTHVAQPQLRMLVTVGVWVLSVVAIPIGATVSWHVTRRCCAGSANVKEIFLQNNRR